MKIYYFNINYTCNSNCVFCYSHNTVHTSLPHNEICCEEIIRYLKNNNISSEDRVIINGGEPLLHSEFINILKHLVMFGCEVLIYTNGRCVDKYDYNFINEKFRFIIPLHGYREIHDMVTRVPGSFDEMAAGFEHLSKFTCKSDAKVILNPFMLESEDDFIKTVEGIRLLKFNNAIHITRMADTIVSKNNRVPSMANDKVAKYTYALFNQLKDTVTCIKIFDTCIKEFDVIEYSPTDISIKVFFKDAHGSFEFTLRTLTPDCKIKCQKARFCESAVSDYTVLEYRGKFYKNLE